MLRLTKSQWFAVEMAQAVLRNRRHLFFEEMGLGQIWDDVDITPDPDSSRIINLKIHVRGFNRRVWVKCVLALDSPGQVDHGECHIELRGNQPFMDSFTCLYVNGEMRYFAGIRGIHRLGLDADIVADLKAADVLMEDELRDLTEIDACNIFTPVNTARDREEIDRAVLDKFRRFYAVLDEKNIRLEGPRHSREELLMML